MSQVHIHVRRLLSPPSGLKGLIVYCISQSPSVAPLVPRAPHNPHAATALPSPPRPLRNATLEHRNRPAQHTSRHDTRKKPKLCACTLDSAPARRSDTVRRGGERGREADGGVGPPRDGDGGGGRDGRGRGAVAGVGDGEALRGGVHDAVRRVDEEQDVVVAGGDVAEEEVQGAGRGRCWDCYVLFRFISFHFILRRVGRGVRRRRRRKGRKGMRDELM